MLQNKLAELKALRKNKKGFTLVEIIVVLAILAILIGALTPTMMAFIDDARGKALVAEARVGVVAAQMVYMENKTLALTDDFKADPVAKSEQFARLTAELRPKNDATDGVFSGINYDGDGHVTALTYARNGTQVTVANGVTTITRP